MTVISSAKNRMQPADGHRVLYLIDRLHMIEAGAEGVVHKLCRLLPQYGFHCSVVTFGTGDGVEGKFPCEVRVLPFSKPYFWSALQNGRTLARLLRSENVEIMHTFFPISDIWGGIVARLAGCPILVSGRRDMGILRSRKHRIQYRIANRAFTQVQAVSEKVREFCIREDGLSPEKVVTIPNGVDLARIDSSPQADRQTAFDVTDGSPVVITVANLRPVKGIDTLVKAAALVCRQFPQATFAIIGEAHEEIFLHDLQSLASSLGIERRIRFMGRRTDVYSLLKASDVFCLPSRSEGMSNALLEAMACGLPCVATDVGGNPEVVVEGQTGFLVSPEDPEALAERITNLLQNPDHGKHMGQHGRQIVEAKFTLERMIEHLAHLYRALLEKRGLRSASHCEQATEALAENRRKVLPTAAR